MKHYYHFSNRYKALVVFMNDCNRLRANFKFNIIILVLNICLFINQFVFLLRPSVIPLADHRFLGQKMTSQVRKRWSCISLKHHRIFIFFLSTFSLTDIEPALTLHLASPDLVPRAFNLVPRAFPLKKNGRSHFCRESPGDEVGHPHHSPL